jgi:hypothetical protein
MEILACGGDTDSVKMRLSSLIPWGPGAAKTPQNPVPSPSRPSPAWSAGVEGRIVWTAPESAEYQATGVRVIDSSDRPDLVVVQVERPVPAGAAAWLLLADEPPRPAGVQRCEPVESGYQLDLKLYTAVSPSEGWGSTRLLWTDLDGEVARVPASIRNGANGCIEVNAARPAPIHTLVSIEAAERACLGIATAAIPYGRRALLTVEIISEARRRPAV